MSQDLPRSLTVALCFQDPPEDVTPVIDAAREAVEGIVVPGLDLDLAWETSLVTPADDLGRGGGRRRGSRSWDLLRSGGSGLESGTMSGYRPDLVAELPPDLTASPVTLVARLLPGRPATLAWSVHAWAVADWPFFLRRACAWLVTQAESLGASSGFITLDLVDAHHPSVWEAVVGVSPAERDFDRWLWGFGWSTVLSDAQAAAVGGQEALGTLPGAEIRISPSGRVWLRLGPDPRDLDRAQLRALRERLGPVLAPGLRTVEEYFDTSADPFASPLPYLL